MWIGTLLVMLRDCRNDLCIIEIDVSTWLGSVIITSTGDIIYAKAISQNIVRFYWIFQFVIQFHNAIVCVFILLNIHIVLDVIISNGSLWNQIIFVLLFYDRLNSSSIILKLLNEINNDINIRCHIQKVNEFLSYLGNSCCWI